jgi:hypothetical protein
MLAGAPSVSGPAALLALCAARVSPVTIETARLQRSTALRDNRSNASLQFNRQPKESNSAAWPDASALASTWAPPGRLTDTQLEGRERETCAEHGGYRAHAG